MTDRLTIDQINSDQLDALYEQLERAQRIAMDVLDDGPLERVRNLHQPMQRGALTVCAHCSGWDAKRQRCHGVLTDYPCDTLRALGGPEPEEPRLAETGIHTPGCTCGHEGMGVSWHGDDCPWRAAVLDGSTPEPTPDGLHAQIAAAIRDCPARYPDDIATAVLAVILPATRITATLARMSNTDVSRVIDLHERWVKAGPPPIGTSINRWWDMRLAELHTALSGPQDGPETPDAGTETPDTPNGRETGIGGFDGPTIADCAEADRVWPLQKGGE